MTNGFAGTRTAADAVVGAETDPGTSCTLLGTLGKGGKGCGGVKAPSLSTVNSETITAAAMAAAWREKEINIERHIADQTPR
jgi:hypothetical protein